FARRSATLTCHSASGSATPCSENRPRRRKAMPSARRSVNESCAADESRICPPWLAQHTRAAMWTAMPTYPVSVSVGRPVCMPMRTSTSAFWGQLFSRSARWIASAASSAGALTGRVVLEVDLIESREGVAYVRDVVDRQPAAALGIDIGERAVWESRAGGGAKRWHGSGHSSEKKMIER